MIKITYDEAYFDPYEHVCDYNRLTRYTMEVNTPEEYTEIRTAILDPEYGRTLIDPPELPEEPDPAWFVQEPTELDRVLEFYTGLMEGYEGA